MFDAMNFGAFKTGYANGQRRESAAFALDIRPGYPLRDRVSGVDAICNIPGDRWGLVNGVLTRIPAYKPAVVDDGLRVCPAFTQLAQKTEDLTDSAWSKTNLSVPLLSAQVYGQNTFFMSETTTNGIHSLSKSAWFSGAAVDNSVIGISCIIKYSGRKIAIAFTKRDSTFARVRTLNGVIENTDVGINASLKDIGDGYYSFFAAMNVGVGGAAPQAYLQLLNDANNTSYVGYIDKGLYVGHISFINFGVNGIPFIPPYVPNNTTGSISVASESATATTGISSDLDGIKLARLKNALRGPNAQGHLALTFKSHIDAAFFGSSAVDINLITVNNNIRLLFFSRLADGRTFIKSIDTGLHEVALQSAALETDGQYNIYLDYGTYTDGTQKMRITVNGVQSAITPFSGSFGFEDLCIGFGNTIDAFRIQSFVAYDRPQW